MFPIHLAKRTDENIHANKRKYSQVQDQLQFEKPQDEMKWSQKELAKKQTIPLIQYLKEYKIDFPKEFFFRSRSNDIIEIIFI